ncbi:MAG: hypothetical protein ACTSWC_09405, partial [Promethearchaeota archaeon]
QVAMELFDEALNPVPTIQTFFNRTQNGYAVIEPAGVALEDFLLPLAMLAGSAENRAAHASKLDERYAHLLAQGDINFTNTDLPYE